MFPGTTSSVAPFFAPRRFPGPGAALLARPWEAWEAERESMGVRREDEGEWCVQGDERRSWREKGQIGNRGGGILWYGFEVVVLLRLG